MAQLKTNEATHKPARDAGGSTGKSILPAKHEALPPSLIEPSPFNPRKNFNVETVRKLGESLKIHGQLQPCVVRERKKTTGNVSKIYYELIAGERRWRAASFAKLPTIDCKVIDVDDAIDEIIKQAPKACPKEVLSAKGGKR